MATYIIRPNQYDPEMYEVYAEGVIKNKLLLACVLHGDVLDSDIQEIVDRDGEAWMRMEHIDE